MLKWLTKENAKLTMDKARAKEIMVDQLDKWNQTQGLMVEIAKEVKRMREEIESLKCCGNCKYYKSKAITAICLNQNSGKYYADLLGNDKCDHWQKL